ncbi:hypothetical protein EYR38_004656 [Pleurotus pulmonarius]|nr:hypothetical protein EYR38_004656 [Pleurotus pulmonarius]
MVGISSAVLVTSPTSSRYTSTLRAELFIPTFSLRLLTFTMQFTIKFAALAFLAQVAVIAAFPLYAAGAPREIRQLLTNIYREQGYDNDLEARGPTKRPTVSYGSLSGKRDEDLEARGPTKRPTVRNFPYSLRA